MTYARQNDAFFRLGLIAERIRNPRRLLIGPVVDELQNMFRAIFVSQGALIGPPWRPLKPATVYRKLVRGQGFGHILRAEDRLFNSLTDRNASGATRRVIGEDMVEVGTSVPYAKYHRTGTRHMVRRDFIPDDVHVPPETTRNLLTLVKRWLTLDE